MKLLLLYGAPGTGKLTIGKELAMKTGFVLFHNHMILNALSEIFGYEHPTRRKLEKEFRSRIIEESVSDNINLICTGVIMRDNEDFYKKVIHMVTSKGGECLLVHLTTSNNVLEKRIGNLSRKALTKISTIERLHEWSKQYPESFDRIDYPHQVSIDTSNSSPEQIADTIIQEYKLI